MGGGNLGRVENLGTGDTGLADGLGALGFICVVLGAVDLSHNCQYGRSDYGLYLGGRELTWR